MRAFVETVEAKGLSAAARRLQVPRARVSKQIQALERMLGVPLLMRTTRRLHLTSVGLDYFESARAILAALEEAELRAQAGVGQPRGVLRVNSPMSFGLRVLGPLLPRFHAQYPGIELQLVLADQLIDPIQGGFDVTIRIASLSDSTLAARMIMPAPRVLVAAPQYLQRVGTLAAPQTLEEHAFLNYSYLQSGAALWFSRKGEKVRVHPTGPLCANNGDVLAMAAEAGLGITLVPRFIVDERLRDGRLVQVLPEWSAPPISVNALFCASPDMPQKTRRFIDFLVAELGGEPEAGASE